MWLFTAALLGIFQLRTPGPTSTDKITARLEEAKRFCKTNKMDTTLCFMLDLSIHNGRKRFFVYNLTNGSLLTSGLVAHGACGNQYRANVLYGNKEGCGCSSLGKYRVGNFYRGNFGDAFKLHGLDSSNNLAYARFVVLHAHSCIPEKEVYPDMICNSNGCPTVSPLFLQELKKYIQQRKRPILLWVVP